MRTSAIALAAIFFAAGCSAELAERPPAESPASAAATEAPFRTPPRYRPDPLVSPPPATAKDPRSGAP